MHFRAGGLEGPKDIDILSPPIDRRPMRMGHPIAKHVTIVIKAENILQIGFGK